MHAGFFGKTLQPFELAARTGNRVIIALHRIIGIIAHTNDMHPCRMECGEHGFCYGISRIRHIAGRHRNGETKALDRGNRGRDLLRLRRLKLMTVPDQ